jgi:hypothetical protein
MNKIAIVLVVVAACGGTEDKTKPVGAAKPIDTTTCPMPKNPDVRERFAVGVTPDYRVNAMAGEAAKCHDEFIANEVVKLDGGTPRTVVEGTFLGHCPGEPTITRTFEAVKPAKAEISVNATHTDLGGELGAGKPAILDSKMPDRLVGISVGVVDRCGAPLSIGNPGNVTTWTLADGCEKIAKLTPYDATADAMKSQEMQIAPVGPGTCTLTAELLGVKGDISITVK